MAKKIIRPVIPKLEKAYRILIVICFFINFAFSVTLAFALKKYPSPTQFAGQTVLLVISVMFVLNILIALSAQITAVVSFFKNHGDLDGLNAVLLFFVILGFIVCSKILLLNHMNSKGKVIGGSDISAVVVSLHHFLPAFITASILLGVMAVASILKLFPKK